MVDLKNSDDGTIRQRDWYLLQMVASVTKRTGMAEYELGSSLGTLQSSVSYLLLNANIIVIHIVVVQAQSEPSSQLALAPTAS